MLKVEEHSVFTCFMDSLALFKFVETLKTHNNHHVVNHMEQVMPLYSVKNWKSI